MKLRNLFARSKPIRTFEELKKCDAKVIGYHEKTGHREGAGSLYQEAISAQILCDLAGKILACPPFHYLHHHQSAGDTLETYLQKWSNLFSPLQLHHYQSLWCARASYLENPKAMLDGLSEKLFENGVARMRQKFHESTPSLIGGPCATVAIHLRNMNQEDEERGEAGTDYGYFSHTFNAQLNPEKNLERLIRLQKTLLARKHDLFSGAETLKLIIISQGVLPGIQTLEKVTSVEYYLDEHPTRSFQRMLESNLLVMAQSSFSYLACLLRYQPNLCLRRFRHRLPHNCSIAEFL